MATGKLEGETLTCPWHGFQYNLTDGKCLADPSARLDMYPVAVHDGKVYLEVPDLAAQLGSDQAAPAKPTVAALKPNEFKTASIAPGKIGKVKVNGEDVAVFNVGGTFYATQEACTHAAGPLSESDIEGKCVTCVMHGSQFDVTTGKVLGGPADEPLKVYKVTVTGDVGRVE